VNSVERVMAAVGGQPVDRTPVLPALLQQGARELGIGLSSYFGQPTRLAEGQALLVERYEHDGVFAFPHVVQDTLPWGAGLNFHDDGPPSVNRMAINRYEEIDQLPDADPTAHPYLKGTLKAAQQLSKRYGGDRLIVGAVIGPFSLPTLLMGTGKFLALVLHHERERELYLRTLMRKMLAYSTAWANAQLEAGCDLVVVAEGIASATVISERTFLRDALPQLQAFVRGVRGPVGVEMVGDALPFAAHLKSLPCAAYLIGSTDPVVAMRRTIGPGKALIGNVNNLKLIRWDAERVEFEALRAIGEAGPGFILGNQGPEIPWYVPDENIAALVQATRKARLAVATPAAA